MLRPYGVDDGRGRDASPTPVGGVGRDVSPDAFHVVCVADDVFVVVFLPDAQARCAAQPIDATSRYGFEVLHNCGK